MKRIILLIIEKIRKSLKVDEKGNSYGWGKGTLLLVVLIIIGCGKVQRVTHKYEVLLSTKDTMYVDAWDYESSSATFTSKRTVRFYDTRYKNILTINDPIYIREIK